MFDYLVVGKGLIGSAAFRYLSQLSANTVLVGPDEPVNPARHDGVYGAHYDDARLTHLHGKSPIWGELCRRSIARYHVLEKESSIPFYDAVGELFVADPGIDSSYHDAANIENSRSRLGVDLQVLTGDQQQAHFPYLTFPSQSAILWEKQPAGRINPRAMIRAQLAVGQKFGGQIVSEMVTAVTPVSDHLLVTTGSGDEYRARRVLVAAGSFANGFDLLPRRLALRCKTEMVIFARVSEAEAARLAAMPVVHYDLNSPTLANIYMVQPICYPDGFFYLKLGANTVEDQFLTSVSEMKAWYANGDSRGMKVELQAAVEKLLPDLKVQSWHMGRCVITRTPHSLPMIDSVLPEQLYIAVGGNGSSAACADEIGHLAARLAHEGTWQDDLAAESFTAVYE